MSNVLLVEDDIAIAELYRIKIHASGFTVKIAANGLLGLKALDNFKPDIVLLDLMMPYMDGETFLRLFRKKLEYVDVPVIVLTNISKSESPKTLWHYGISGYIVKAHSTPKEIVELIEQTLTKQS